MIWLYRIRYWIKAWGLRLRFLFRKQTVEEEMEEEIRFHIEMEIRKNLSEGMSPGEARRQAHLTFGGIERTKEGVRDRRGTRPLEDLIDDARYASRQLRKTPLFTLVAILTLAIGIGANTSIFSLVNGALLRNRPFRDADELVNVYTAIENLSLYAPSFANDLDDLRALDEVFEGVAAYRGTASRIEEPDGARMVLIEAVTSNLFPLVGLEMALGRNFTVAEGSPGGSDRVTILGHGFWKERYAGDRGVLGQTIRLAGVPFIIIGVAPDDHESFTAQGFQASLFVPMPLMGLVAGSGEEESPSGRGGEGYKIIARVNPGITLDQAQTRLDGLALGLREDFPGLYRDRTFNLFPSASVALQPDVDVFFMKAAILLMASVGIVLLLAATNLAGSLLARGLDRQEEIGLRLALGAGRGRLVRQFLTETLVLGTLGSLAGLLLGTACLDLLSSLAPPTSLPLSIDTGMDTSMFLFTVGITGSAVLFAGLAPALQTTRTEESPILRGGRGSGGHSRVTLQQVLVGIQMSLSMVLLVTGALFIRSLRAAEGMDPGFGARDAGMIWLDLGVAGIPSEDRERVADELVRRAEALPGIQEVAISNGVPLSEAIYQRQFLIPGVEPPPGEDGHWAHFLTVNGSFLSLMDMPLLAGRGILETDRTGTEPVVVVSESAARRYWPGEEPLGKIIQVSESSEAFRVVGVIRDTKVANFREGPTPLLLFSHRQDSRRSDQLWLMANGRESPAEIMSELRGMVREMDPELVVVQTETMAEHLSSALALPRMAALFTGFFGLLALLLASLGLYGLVSYGASRRTREVGIRMSLGAGEGSVVRMVVRDGMGPVWAGTLFGIIGALVLAQFASGYLIGIGPFDLPTLVGVPLLLLAVSAVAAWIPAHRASRINPVQALRAD